MAEGRLGRLLMGPFLVVDLVVDLILLGLASWSLNNYIDGDQHHPHLGGNSATSYMLMFALLGGTTGAASVLAGFAHIRAWCVETMAAAATTATVALGLMGLAFGLAWKEIKLGGHRGKRLQTLEVFIIMSTLIQLLYIMLLLAGNFNQKYGPCYGGSRPESGGQGPAREPPKTAHSESAATLVD